MNEIINSGGANQYENLETVKSLFKEFRPIAFYDKHLDCIRVQLKDCSFTEKRLNRYFTILEENHVTSYSLTGFNIKGIQYLAQKLNFSMTGVMKLTDLIDKIVKNYPDSSAQIIEQGFFHVLRKENLEINFQHETAA